MKGFLLRNKYAAQILLKYPSFIKLELGFSSLTSRAYSRCRPKNSRDRPVELVLVVSLINYCLTGSSVGQKTQKTESHALVSTRRGHWCSTVESHLTCYTCCGTCGDLPGIPHAGVDGWGWHPMVEHKYIPQRM